MSSSDEYLVKLFQNKVVIQLPLKHQEIYRFTHNPEFLGPLVRQSFLDNIVLSDCVLDH